VRFRGKRMVVEGRIKDVDELDPGPPILRSRYEWRARYKKYLFIEMLTYAIVLLVVLAIVAVILYILIPDLSVGIIIIALVTIAILGTELWSRGFIDKDHPPGLYQEGLMHPKGFFLPYEEVRDIHETRSPIPVFPMKIAPVPFYEDSFEDYSDWAFEAHILGDNGVEELRDRVSRINAELDG
jgi:hypothetical protein